MSEDGSDESFGKPLPTCSLCIKKPYCTRLAGTMSAAYAVEKTLVRAASRSASPDNSSVSDADTSTAPTLPSSSPGGRSVLSSKRQKRAVNRQLKICQRRLMNVEVCDNGGRHKLTNSCGGLFIYMPTRGKMTAAATSKLDGPFRQRGCLSLIDSLAEKHGWSADGSQSDPSLFAIMQTVVTSMLGTVSQQPDLLPMSGKQCCSVWCCAMIAANLACTCMQAHSSSYSAQFCRKP